METSNIPRFFWISLSFCMVVATLGVLGIAWQSTSISIEVANTKINMSTALSDMRDIKNELELENEKLLNEKKSLRDLLHDLETAYQAPNNEPEEILQSYFMTHQSSSNVEEHRQKRLETLDKQIKTLEKTLKIQ